MDPDATLANILRTIDLWNEGKVKDRTLTLDTLTESLEALDDWISHGGYLPQRWTDVR
jgi:hypothetical protein